MSGRASVLGVEVDAVDQSEAVRIVMDLAAEPGTSIVATANLDHAVRLRRSEPFRRLYDQAEVVLADGFPLVLASRLRGPGLPGRVTGADLIVPICREAGRRNLRIFVVGSTLGILAKACRRLEADCPGLTIAGIYAPPFGFHAGHPESEHIVSLLRAAQPDIVFVALGSPKQEVWADAQTGRLTHGVFICVGAGFDYLAGQPRRAPKLIQRLCLEWLWRLAHDPHRLAKRYAINLLYLPLLLAEHVGLGARRPPTRALRGARSGRTGFAD